MATRAVVLPHPPEVTVSPLDEAQMSELEPCPSEAQAVMDAGSAASSEQPAAGMERRRFIRVAAAAVAATGALGSGAAIAQQPPAAGRGGGAGGGRGGGAGGQQVPQAPPIPLGQGDPPALQFQAYPGGTGALMEKLIKERGAAAFERKPIEIEPWTGPAPSNEEDLAFLPAHRLGALLKARHVSSLDLTNIYLERMKRYDPVLLCAVTILEARAREEAQQADAELRAGEWKGPLHGVPWGVKDLFAARGAPTTWGSADFQNQVLDYDSEIIVRLRNAGAVLIAKLATGQFAAGDNWFRGQTKNPWNTAQGSSGSSAGPGSATAAGLVGFAIGTETQGSITSPAGRNGLSALRPTFGRITRHGGMVLSWSQDKPGPMCRTIEDCALVFNVVHGSDPKDPSTVTTPFEFRRLPNLNGLRIAHAANAPEAFLTSLREMGATLSELPELPNPGGSSFGPESAAAFDYWVAERVREAEARGETPTGRFMGNGRTSTALDFINGMRRRWIMMQQWDEVLKNYDLFVGGLASGPSNQTGHPAVVVPYAFESTTNNEGVVSPAQPRTVTLFGHVFDDDKVLSVAHAYQIKHDWHLRRPELPA
jgi:Asp-tRNA(Asn)/Glu-tRNA(Gln) amidotransferase A subunit family amidase